MSDMLMINETVACNVGDNYLKIMKNMHEWLDFKNYLEIGVNKGATLQLARCDSIAVDPRFVISSDVLGVKKKCLFFQMTSDRFFGEHDPRQFFDGEPVDATFLDGLHEYEVLLRDFFNAERFSETKSVIIIHDCVPTDIHLTRRQQTDDSLKRFSRTPGRWTGDVWKALLILKEVRKDLKIETFDADPTGLVFVTSLKPNTTPNFSRLQQLISHYRDVNMANYGLKKYLNLLNIRSSKDIDSPEKAKLALDR